MELSSQRLIQYAVYPLSHLVDPDAHLEKDKKKKTQQTFIYFLEVEKVYDLIFKYTNKTFSTKFLSPYL